MTDDDGDSGSDSGSDTVPGKGQKARLAETPDEDPRGSSDDSESSGDE